MPVRGECGFSPCSTTHFALHIHGIQGGLVHLLYLRDAYVAVLKDSGIQLSPAKSWKFLSLWIPKETANASRLKGIRQGERFRQELRV